MQLLVEMKSRRSPKKRSTSSSKLKTSLILILSATSVIKRRLTPALCLADTLSAAAASLNSSSISASAPCAAWSLLQTSSLDPTMRALPRHKLQLKLSNNHQKSMSGLPMAIDMKLFSLKTRTIVTNGRRSSASKATRSQPAA